MAATAGVVDLSNVSEGGSFRPRRKPEGDYRAKIVKADDHQPKDKSKPRGWVLTIQVEGDARSSYPYYLSPDAKQAWKVGQVCRAAGLNVRNAKVRFDPNKLVGKTIGIYLTDDEYEGREKSAIDDVFPASEVSANADEEPEEIAEDEDEILDDEPVEDDEPEEEDEPEEPAPRASQAAAARKRTKANTRQPEPEPEDDDEDEDEDEEDTPPPPPRKRTVKKAAPKPPPPADDEDDEDLDLDDLDED